MYLSKFHIIHQQFIIVIITDNINASLISSNYLPIKIRQIRNRNFPNNLQDSNCVEAEKEKEGESISTLTII